MGRAGIVALRGGESAEKVLPRSLCLAQLNQLGAILELPVGEPWKAALVGEVLSLVAQVGDAEILSLQALVAAADREKPVLARPPARPALAATGVVVPTAAHEVVENLDPDTLWPLGQRDVVVAPLLRAPEHQLEQRRRSSSQRVITPSLEFGREICVEGLEVLRPCRPGSQQSLQVLEQRRLQRVAVARRRHCSPPIVLVARENSPDPGVVDAGGDMDGSNSIEAAKHAFPIGRIIAGELGGGHGSQRSDGPAAVGVQDGAIGGAESGLGGGGGRDRFVGSADFGEPDQYEACEESAAHSGY